VICDNLAAHKAPAVRRWLLAHPRVQLHFTPTYSSWISQAGRWFAELQRRCLDRGAFCSLDELTTALEDWIKIWNARGPGCAGRRSVVADGGMPHLRATTAAGSAAAVVTRWSRRWPQGRAGAVVHECSAQAGDRVRGFPAGGGDDHVCCKLPAGR